jgi:hypothetical protein
MRRTRHEIPSVILQEGSVFVLHGGTLIGIGKRNMISLWHPGEGRCMVQGQHQETMLRPSGHGVLVLRRQNGHRTLGQGRRWGRRRGGQRGCSYCKHKQVLRVHLVEGTDR